MIIKVYIVNIITIKMFVKEIIQRGFIISHLSSPRVVCKKSKLLPYLEALFAVIVWGGSFIATKIAVGQISPVAVVWLRFAMGIPMILFAVIVRKQFTFPKGNEWWYFTLLGFLGITLHQWLQSNGLKTAQATTTAWIVATSPAFIAILGWLVLKEKLKLFAITAVSCSPWSACWQL